MLQSGKQYKESEMAEGGEDTSSETTETPTLTVTPMETLGMTDVVRLLVEDQQARERELCEQMEMLHSLIELRPEENQLPPQVTEQARARTR